MGRYRLYKETRDTAAEGDVWIGGWMSRMPPLASKHEAVIDGHVESSYREARRGAS